MCEPADSFYRSLGSTEGKDAGKQVCLAKLYFFHLIKLHINLEGVRDSKEV